MTSQAGDVTQVAATTSMTSRRASDDDVVVVDDEQSAFLPSRDNLSVTSSRDQHHRFSYVCETMLLDHHHHHSPSLPGGSQVAAVTSQQQPLSPSLPYMMTSSRRHNSVASSVGEIVTSLPLRSSVTSSSITSSSSVGAKQQIRHSFGQEWTKNHWDKIRELEQTSSQARRCSKLSSGFAPLMIFGGLVFVCIGVSANFNTQSRDRDKLRRLSVAPLVMGSFMLALGVLLLVTWFACRTRARHVDRHVLHGSVDTRGNSLLSSIFSKTHGYHNPAHSDASFVVHRPPLPAVHQSTTTLPKDTCTRCSIVHL